MFIIIVGNLSFESTWHDLNEATSKTCTLQQVESQRDSFTETLVETKKALESTTSVLKEDLRVVVTRAERAQTMKLLNLQLYDLHMNEEATKTAAK